MEFIDMLMWLVIGHFLCDFPLQNDYLAVNKNPVLVEKTESSFISKANPLWLWCMTAHSFIHALPVMWLTGKIELAILMIVTHFTIDYVKCIGRISFNEDQVLHLLVVFLIATIAVGF